VRAGSVLSRQGAHGITELELTQAAVWSYVDDFRYLTMVCLCCIPIVFGLRKVKARPGAAPAAH